MPYLNPNVADAALDYIRAQATHLHYCTSEPASFAAVAGASLGSVVPTIGANGAGSPSGRKATVTTAAGTYSTGGAVGYWALVNQAGSLLLATNAVATPKTVNAGDTITDDPFDITIPAAVSA